MDASAFSMLDYLISYGEDRQASRISRQLDRLGDQGNNCVIGVFEFSDDRSVHADHWERYPAGDEILCVLEGRLCATVDRDGAVEEAVIEPGMAFIVPRGNWHRLRVLESGRLLFFTPAAGSELRAVHDPITEGRLT